jgi:hypothetical protein
MIFAYADPPYVGQARKLYDCAEIDHEELLFVLGTYYSDGWMLSCSSPSLRQLLPLAPSRVRIAAWVKPFHAFKRGVRPAYAWEPIIFAGGRNSHPPVPPKGGKAITPKDFTIANITLRKGLVGAKPDTVCAWLLDLLNVAPGDTLVDLFPGTGAMSRAARDRGLHVPTLTWRDHQS